MISNKERRQNIKGICQVLRSDLYERGESHKDEDSNSSATWWNAGFSVTYGCNEDNEVWLRLRDSKDRLYAEVKNGDEYWLDSKML
jgi:hypothetical protein